VLNFRFLDPGVEIEALAAAGLELVVRLDRLPHDGIEHQSRRSYLLVRRSAAPDWLVGFRAELDCPEVTHAGEQIARGGLAPAQAADQHDERGSGESLCPDRAEE